MTLTRETIEAIDNTAGLINKQEVTVSAETWAEIRAALLVWLALQPRPISEAPKDGTEVLAYREDAGFFTAFYGACDCLGLSDHEAEEIDEDTFWFESWWCYTRDGATRLEDDLVPTTFVPLSALPKPNEEKS